MKLSFRQIEPFVQKPDQAALAILVYGPDAGLMRERAAQIARSVVSDLNDPFNVAVMTGEALAQDPARLGDEARAISMMGGRRLVRITEASDKITMTLKEYLASPDANALVLLEAGELGARSSLRLLCERAENAAAVPCYVDDAQGAARVIREVLQGEGRRAEDDALAWLAVAIGGDRQKLRMEVEKLLLYKGADASPITLEEARAVCGDAGAQGLDELVYAVGRRDGAQALRVLEMLWEDGVNFVMILRALQNHFRRLHFAGARVADGESAEDVMKTLSPPVFFKLETQFRAQMQSWRPATLESVLRRLHDLEAQCKQTGAPVEILCAQAILSLSGARAAA